MRCKTLENYDSFKCPLNSPKGVPLLRQHKSSRSEDIDLLQFNLQENLQVSEMNYSSVHEVSLTSSARNSTEKNEIIRKQDEIIKRQEQQIKVLKNIIVNQQYQNPLETQLKQINTFVQRIFSELCVNKENVYDIQQLQQKDFDCCLYSIQQQKLRLKEQNKFIQCMQDLIVSCSPPNHFQNTIPNLKQVWRFIKAMLNECIEVKKNYQEHQLCIQQIQRILQVSSPKQIIPYLLIYKPNKM